VKEPWKAHVEAPEGVTAQILSLIQERKLVPGDKLPSERALAQRLNVSRPALRESLAALEAMRIIARRPNSGIYLAEHNSPPSFESVVFRSELGLPLDIGTIMHSMEVRNLLELQAVTLACERHTAEDFSHLGAIVEQTHVRLREGGTIIDLDEAFHLGIVAAAHNPVFLQIVHAFYRLSRLRRSVYFSDSKRCRRSHREHQAILAAIAARDPTAAREAMHAHIHEGFWGTLLKQRLAAETS
jgi:GntR family transcriptional regulator, transcriptional repressor for pyruvate dehydrogenase complex